MRATREFLRLIEASLVEQTGDWSADRFNITNSKRGVVIWIANGAFGIELRANGAEMSLPFGWKRRLRRAVDTCIAKQIAEKFRSAA